MKVKVKVYIRVGKKKSTFLIQTKLTRKKKKRLLSKKLKPRDSVLKKKKCLSQGGNFVFGKSGII